MRKAFTPGSPTRGSARGRAGGRAALGVDVDDVRVRAVRGHENRPGARTGALRPSFRRGQLARDELAADDAAAGDAREQRPDEDPEVDDHHAERLRQVGEAAERRRRGETGARARELRQARGDRRRDRGGHHLLAGSTGRRAGARARRGRSTRRARRRGASRGAYPRLATARIVCVASGLVYRTAHIGRTTPMASPSCSGRGRLCGSSGRATRSGSARRCSRRARRRLTPRIDEADHVVPSVCPYCAVGCGQLVYV